MYRERECFDHVFDFVINSLNIYIYIMHSQSLSLLI